MRRSFGAVVAVGLVAGGLTGQRDLAAGFGAQSQRLELDRVTGKVGNLGVTHLDGEIFVTSRHIPWNPIPGQHFVSVFDVTGTRLRSWTQPTWAQASEWGFRDGASDGNNLFFGYDFGIQIVDVDGNPQLASNGPNVLTANGPRTTYNLIAGNILKQTGIVRALAYDRSGNSGEGSFWTGSFLTSIFEIDLNGDVLRYHPNSGHISYGFAIDPTSDRTRMWINAGSTSEDLAEYDLTTGTLTGVTMTSVQGIQGGLDIVPGSLGRGPGASGYDILHLQQDIPDEIRIRRLHLDVAGSGIPASPATRPGTIEPDLLSAIDDEDRIVRSDRGQVEFSDKNHALNLYFDISRNPGDGMGAGGLNGVPAVIFTNLGVDAAPGNDAMSNLLGIRELVHLQPLLTIPAPTQSVRSRGMVLTNDSLSPNPSEWRIPLAPGMLIQPIGGCLRFQGLWIDNDVNFLPLAMTNQTRLCRGLDRLIPEGTYAEFLGPNSMNADQRFGFFSLTNMATDPARSIVSATWSLRPGSPDNSPITQAQLDEYFRWDTDSDGMADRFDGGNSLLADCLGTYRRNSEVSTGLIFAGTPKQNRLPCDPGGMQGWIGSDDGPTVYGSFRGDWLTLEFRFSPDTFMNGAEFHWDCDTDGGLGVNGGAMAGVVVSVEYKDGSVSSNIALPDPLNPERAYVQL